MGVWDEAYFLRYVTTRYKKKGNSWRRERSVWGQTRESKNEREETKKKKKKNKGKNEGDFS